jgi:hypothetical protein
VRSSRSILLPLGLLAALASAESRGAAQAIPLAVRGQAVSQAVLARSAEMQDSFAVDACSVWRGLGRGALYAELLDPRVRARVQGDVAHCGTGSSAAQANGIWILDSVRRGNSGTIVVRATWLVPFSRQRAETYVVKPDAGGRWSVTEIRLDRSIEKAGQPLIPGREPPSPGTAALTARTLDAWRSARSRADSSTGASPAGVSIETGGRQGRRGAETGRHRESQGQTRSRLVRP